MSEKGSNTKNTIKSIKPHKSLSVTLKKTKSFENKAKLQYKSIKTKSATKYFSDILFKINLNRNKKSIKANYNNINLIRRNKDGYGNNYNLSCLREYPRKLSILYTESYKLNILNIFSNCNNDYGILLKGRVPNIFYDHLLTNIKISNNESIITKEGKNINKNRKIKRNLLVVRNKAKITSVIYYSYSNK